MVVTNATIVEGLVDGQYDCRLFKMSCGGCYKITINIYFEFQILHN
jgi:hypothetical protein